ncbi:MAG: hypothetical protein C3F13_00640 [Anaerolineales bacterium]|nr:hypothetical protein [Anaerolineae bacterium]PWB56615.1 MAG: hypothetical protein C3F13_00640 [Anaerolineales bacterium]
MAHKYHALRTIGSIFRVVGYIFLVLTILSALAVCGLTVIGGTTAETLAQEFGTSTTGAGFLGGLVGGLLLGLLVILYGGLISLMLVAFGEGIYLLIDVEENTRRTSYLMENQNKLQPAEPKPLPPTS